MYIKIILTNPTREVPINNQKSLNSFIHRCIGKDNKFHDAFSDYAISGLMGGTLNSDKKTLSFNEYPYFFITDNNKELLSKLVTGLCTMNEDLFGMKFKTIEMCDFITHSDYDIISTVSPILLRIKDKSGNEKKITFKDDCFIEELSKHCVRKLEHNGIVDDTFKIILRKPENCKMKCVMVGDTFNPCSHISLYVYGKRETRRKLYNLGFGNSTGSGFGFIKTYN